MIIDYCHLFGLIYVRFKHIIVQYLNNLYLYTIARPFIYANYLYLLQEIVSSRKPV